MEDKERNMSRDEMALRLKIETGLRESYESECTKLKKELEDIKVAFKMEHDENILRRDSLDRLCDKYRELEKKHEDLQKRQNACADVWVKFEERNDELKRTLEAKNEQIKELQTANWRQSDDIVELRKQIDLCTKDLDSRAILLREANANASALSLENEKLKRQIEEQQLKDWKEEGDRKTEEIKKLKEKDEEIERLHKKKNDQRAQLNTVQQALLNRNMKIEALTAESENHRQMYLAQLKENEELRTKLAYSEENADKAKSVSDDILRRDFENNQLKIQNRMLENSNERLLEENLGLKSEKEKLEEINKKLQEDYDSLKLTYGLMKLNPGYFTPPTQPINIENLNVTYYENGPVWTNDDSDEED